MMTDRQQVIFMDSSRQIALSKQPSRVWTLFPDTTHEVPMHVKHRENAFLESRLHDWDYRDGVLYYYSRVADGEVYLLLEF